MHHKIFMEQMKRSKKTILSVLLLMAATAFFVTGVNLYENSLANLQAVEENYSTLAVMELYGDVDILGNLVEPYSEEYEGYKSVAVEGYDVSQIVQSEAVIGWDLRSKYAAYIADTPAMLSEVDTQARGNVVRFKVKGDRPVMIPIAWDVDHTSSPLLDFQMEILDSAAGYYQYGALFNYSKLLMHDRERYREQLTRLNRSEEMEKIILYPDVEYVASLVSFGDWVLNHNTGKLEPREQEIGTSFHPGMSEYCMSDPKVAYGREEFITFELDDTDQLYLHRWEDVQADPALKAFYEGAWKAAPLTGCTFNVELTNDITSVPVYHLGGAALKEGRLITPEEYESGAKVCMVSDRTAKLQGWKVGDRLNMDFYEFEAMVNTNNEKGTEHPFWHRGTKGFFDEGEYEIVGTYTQNPISGNSGIARSTLSMPWYNIYVPEKSVNAPILPEEKKVHGALFSLRLKNGSIDQFLADMDALGLTQAQEGRYNPIFTFYDQGYSVVQPGLEAMITTSELLLILSSVLLMVTCALLAFFFAQGQKQSVGIFRMLGGTKGQAMGAVMACALILTIVGGLLGGALGYGLAQYVGETIVEENLAESQQAAAYEAYVVQTGSEEQLLAVEASPRTTALASGAALLFPAMTLVFVAQYINREARELLPKSGM